MKKLLLILLSLPTLTFAQELSSEYIIKLDKSAVQDVDTEWGSRQSYNKIFRYDAVKNSVEDFADEHYTDTRKHDEYLKAAKAELDRLADALQ